MASVRVTLEVSGERISIDRDVKTLTLSDDPLSMCIVMLHDMARDLLGYNLSRLADDPDLPDASA